MKNNHNPFGTRTWYRRYTDTIEFSEKLNSFQVQYFCGAISAFQESKSNFLKLDFSSVTTAYPNGMLPIITLIEKLRSMGKEIITILPENEDTRRLFRETNWAHYLSPNHFSKSESIHDRHLVTRKFTDAREQKECVDDFMDVIMRSIILPRNIFRALEWSINEITDNVLNHSNSQFGGYVQATTYTKNNTIAFAVADSGIGILNSLKEAIPTLRTDIQAMGEAVKAGVTRNKQFGQGNGLAGSLKITTLSGGSFEITSGTGRILLTLDNSDRKIRSPHQSYQGTLISAQIGLKPDFSISQALDFGTGIDYTPVDMIEMQYHVENADCLKLIMKSETTGFGTRKSGQQIRTKILNLLASEPTFPILIDWNGVPVISSSFADEVMGKLFIELRMLTFSARVRNINMEDLIKNLLDKAASQRLTQSLDDQE